MIISELAATTTETPLLLDPTLTGDNFNLFIMRSDHGYYYVCKTTGIEPNCQDKPWCLKHGITSVVKLIHDKPNSYAKDLTLELMKKYGWQKVRGYAWSQCDMRQPPKDLRYAIPRIDHTSYVKVHNEDITTSKEKLERFIM